MFKKKKDESEIMKTINECNKKLKEMDRVSYYKIKAINIFARILIIPIRIIFIIIVPFYIIKNKLIKRN